MQKSQEIEKSPAVTQTEGQRALFEAWFTANDTDPRMKKRAVERDSKGQYLLMQAASAWNVWQAAHAALCRSAAIPVGWKLVPEEPTESMETHGFESTPHWAFTPREEWEAYEAMSGCQQAAYRARVCYKAMLAAAPQPPVSEGGAA